MSNESLTNEHSLFVSLRNFNSDAAIDREFNTLVNITPDQCGCRRRGLHLVFRLGHACICHLSGYGYNPESGNF